MGEAKRRRREANLVDSEGLLTRLAGIDLAHEDRGARACLTDTLRDFAAMALKADGGAGLVGSRAQAAANIAAHCIIAEAVGYGVREAYLTNSGPAWGGQITFANPPPADAIGPPSPEQIMRRVLMQVSGFAGEMAAKLWRPGSCADDMVVSVSQTSPRGGPRRAGSDHRAQVGPLGPTDRIARQRGLRPRAEDDRGRAPASRPRGSEGGRALLFPDASDDEASRSWRPRRSADDGLARQPQGRAKRRRDVEADSRDHAARLMA